MTGYKQPPQDTRFRKGQSGNPNGRPRRAGGLTQTAEAELAAGRRPVTVREGGETRQLSSVEAVVLAQYKTALSGSAHAQRDILRRHEAAEIERRVQIEAENERWEEIVAGLRLIRVAAAAKGEAPSMPFPHPDDVVIDPERGVRFVGPTNEEEDARLQNTLKTRDLLLAQDVFDRRSWDDSSDDDPDSKPGTAALFAHFMNGAVPKRLRLSDVAIVLLISKYECMTKRELAKHLYQSWTALGCDVRRGKLFPPIGTGKRVITTVCRTLTPPSAHVVTGHKS